MSAYVYASGTYHPLEGNQIVSGGQMVTMKDNDAIVVDGSRYTLGDPVASANVISGAVITTTETYTDATLEDVTVANGGIITVSGGIVKNLNVGSGGSAVLIDAESPSPYSIQITSSGSVLASNSLVNSLSCVSSFAYRQIGGNLAHWNGSGTVYIEDCVMQNKIVFSSLHVSSGGTANSNSVYGHMIVSSGGTANSTSVCGHMIVSSGGTANSTSVKSGCSLRLAGGTANFVTVSSGHMIVSSGGTANYTIISGGYFDGTRHGNLYVSSGGTANSVTLYSGHLHVSSGGYALNVVNYGGTVSAYEGSVVTYANN